MGIAFGFPVFAMNWTDPKTQELTRGFRLRSVSCRKCLYINMLAMLGWNDGSSQELFTLPELVEKFSIDRVHKGGAKFDFEKAKWFNHEWIAKQLPVASYQSQVKALFKEKGIAIGEAVDADAKFVKVLELVKDRCTLLADFVSQASFFFAAPTMIDTAAIQPKWNAAKQQFFAELVRQFQLMSPSNWEAATMEKEFKEMAAAAQIKPGDLLLPFRIMLVGGKFGPGVFEIAAILGREETLHRIRHTLGLLQV